MLMPLEGQRGQILLKMGINILGRLSSQFIASIELNKCFSSMGH